MLLRRSYFPTTAPDSVIDRHNLSINTRRGQNRPWVLGTIIYGRVKNIRLKASFYFLLSLHLPHNRLEYIFLFVPLQLNGNKKFRGVLAHLVHPKLRLWCHFFHETEILMQFPAQGFRKKRVKRDGQCFMLIVLYYLSHNTCCRDPWSTACFLNFCSQPPSLLPCPGLHSGSSRNMMTLHA